MARIRAAAPLRLGDSERASRIAAATSGRLQCHRQRSGERRAFRAPASRCSRSSGVCRARSVLAIAIVHRGSGRARARRPVCRRSKLGAGENVNAIVGAMRAGRLPTDRRGASGVTRSTTPSGEVGVGHVAGTRATRSRLERSHGRTCCFDGRAGATPLRLTDPHHKSAEAIREVRRLTPAARRGAAHISGPRGASGRCLASGC
jgi:hypothetical protein